MTQDEFNKAPKLDQILYDETGMLTENHPSIVEAMKKYAKWYHNNTPGERQQPTDQQQKPDTKQLNIGGVRQQSELLKALNDIIKCCDGNEPTHEQMYHIANDAVKAFNCA